MGSYSFNPACRHLEEQSVFQQEGNSNNQANGQMDGMRVYQDLAIN
jgi:hypothetical protein